MGFEYTFGGSGRDNGHSIAIDNVGNTYSVGHFQGTVDFDPGPGTANLTGSTRDQVAITKVDSDGNLVWARPLVGPGEVNGSSIALDPDGNVYVTGYVSGTADFDPGSGTINLTSSGAGDGFVLKLDGNGDHQWVKQYAGGGLEYVSSVATDPAGGIYITNWAATGWSGSDNRATYTTKLDADGAEIWSNQIDGPGYDSSVQVAIDPDGNIYTSGVFTGTVDFDAGAGTATLTSAGGSDAFITKTDADGNFIWAKNIGGAADDYGGGIDFDTTGNVYMTGNFTGTADFDPGVGSSTLTSFGGQDAYVVKLDIDGDFVWGRQLGSTETVGGNKLAVDAAGNVYTGGYFFGTLDADPGAGAVNMASAGGQDGFLSKLNTDGEFVWGTQIGGTGLDQVMGVQVDGDNSVYVTGPFQNTVDLDLGDGTAFVTSNGSYDGYVIKFEQPNTSPQAADDSATVSENGTATITAATLLANDTDSDGDTVSIASVDSSGLVGALTDNEDGTYTYDPNGQFESLGVGDTAVDSFSYTVSDGNGGTDTATVNITVTGQAENTGTTGFPITFGGPGSANGHSVVVDDDGSIYNIGIFTGTVDFDPGPGITNLTSSSGEQVAIRKFDAGGNLLWAKSIDGTSENGESSSALDSDGNLYVTGFFAGTADFDPGPGTSNLTSSGGFDAYVLKLDGNGDQQWVKQFGGGNLDIGTGIATDGAGNVYATRWSASNWGTSDRGTFTTKLDASGNEIWTNAIDGPGYDSIVDVAQDTDGNIYTSGVFTGTADFDAGGGTAILTSAGGRDAYITKTDADGNFIWAKNFGGASDDHGGEFDFDAAGNVYMSGNFSGTVDLDPGLASTTLTSFGGEDVFVVKIDSGGDFVWGRQLGATENIGANGLTVDAAGNVYTIGSFSGTMDADPGAGVMAQTSAGAADGYISKLNSDGEFIWADRIGGTGSDSPSEVTVDAANTLFVTGSFQNTVDLALGADIALRTSNGARDGFLIRFEQPNDAPTAIDDSATVTENGAVILTATALLANDTDPDGDTLSIASVDDSGLVGALTNNGDGTYIYDPNGQFESLGVGESAVETFSYTVSDGNGGTDTATVSITVNGENDAPTAGDDSVNVSENGTVTITAATLLGNDSDVDTNDSLSVTSVGTAGMAGALTNNGDGTYGYDPNGQFESLGVGESAVDTFSYTVSDGNGGTDTATVSITVNGENDAPTAGDDSVNVLEDATITLQVLTNDSDVDLSDNLSITALDISGTLGGATISGDGQSIIYAADADVFDLLVSGETATDTLSYTVSDGHGGGDTATVGITIEFNDDGITVVGGNKKDVIEGTDGEDTLLGGGGKDEISGGDGADVLSGGNGKDILDGGAGPDFLTGGNGKDTFVLRAGGGDDVVTDFGNGKDELLFDGVTVSSANVLGSDTLLLLSDGGSVTLLDVTADTSADWTFIG